MAQDNYAVTHIMLDIETLGTRPGSVILAIGAVTFDPYRDNLISEFDRSISITSAEDSGLKVDASTVLWWLRQNDIARGTLIRSATFGDTLISVLSKLSVWIGGDSAKRIWSHGASFDTVLLTYAYEAIGFRPPWVYRDIRDTRTIFELAGIGNLNEYRSADDPEHTALADAKVQARAVCDAYRRLGLARV